MKKQISINGNNVAKINVNNGEIEKQWRINGSISESNLRKLINVE
jgi:hypothetical protein